MENPGGICGLYNFHQKLCNGFKKIKVTFIIQAYSLQRFFSQSYIF